MGLKGVLRTIQGGELSFWCAGCKTSHSIRPEQWGFNDNYDKPTFRSSVVVTSGHYTPQFKAGDPCWCSYNAAHPEEPASFNCERCHSQVTDGQILFYGDSTHELKGQTIALEPWGG